jgi:hypothetical protein
VIKDELPEGLRTNAVPGWRACDLPFRSYFGIKRKEFAGEVTAGLIREMGPAVGTLRVNKSYSRDWNGVYRGEDGDPNHAVVCVAYTNSANGELHIFVLDNARQDGPLRWVLYQAFTDFFFIQVNALEREELVIRPVPRRRRTYSMIRKMVFFWK